jgi:hypothetical protein
LESLAVLVEFGLRLVGDGLWPFGGQFRASFQATNRLSANKGVRRRRALSRGLWKALEHGTGLGEDIVHLRVELREDRFHLVHVSFSPKQFFLPPEQMLPEYQGSRNLLIESFLVSLQLCLGFGEVVGSRWSFRLPFR